MSDSVISSCQPSTLDASSEMVGPILSDGSRLLTTVTTWYRGPFSLPVPFSCTLLLPNLVRYNTSVIHVRGCYSLPFNVFFPVSPRRPPLRTIPLGGSV